MCFTNRADDAGTPESPRRLVLGVEVGHPFCSSPAVVLVGVGVGHLVTSSVCWKQEWRCVVLVVQCCSGVKRKVEGSSDSQSGSARADLMRKVLLALPILQQEFSCEKTE